MHKQVARVLAAQDWDTQPLYKKLSKKYIRQAETLLGGTFPEDLFSFFEHYNSLTVDGVEFCGIRTESGCLSKTLGTVPLTLEMRSKGLPANMIAISDPGTGEFYVVDYYLPQCPVWAWDAMEPASPTSRLDKLSDSLTEFVVAYLQGSIAGYSLG